MTIEDAGAMKNHVLERRPRGSHTPPRSTFPGGRLSRTPPAAHRPPEDESVHAETATIASPAPTFRFGDIAVLAPGEAVVDQESARIRQTAERGLRAPGGSL